MTDVSGDQSTIDRAQDRRSSAGVVGPLNVDNIPKAVREEEPPKAWPVWAIKMREKYEHDLTELKRKVEEYEMSIVSQKQAQMHMNALTLHGSEQNVQAMQRQLALSPKFKDLTPDEHEYIARLALGMGLNPEFHFHAWKTKESVKNRKTGVWEEIEVLHVTPDYKALIFKAKSDRRVIMKDRRLTTEEMKARGISDRDIEEGAIAWVVELYDLADSITSKAGGIDYEPLRGYGFWPAKKDKKNGNVTTRVPNDTPNGRDGAWVAWKRATRALHYQDADMSLAYVPPPASASTQAFIVSQDDDVFTYTAADLTLEGEYTEAEQPTEEKPTRWQDDPARLEKAAAWMDSLGVTDEMYTEATGTDWRTYDISADEFKYAVELLSESAHVEAVEVQPEVKPEPAPEAAEPPQEPPAVVDVAASSSEPPQKITDDEISVIALAFKDKHAMRDVLEARHKLAELVGVKSLINYPGTAAELQAVADAWKPEGQLL